MKNLVAILALLITVAVANAQNTTWGLTGKAGSFKTIESSDLEIKDNNYTSNLGLMAGLGLWMSQPLSTSGKIQFTILHTAERQNTGKISLKDDIGDDVFDLSVTDYNLAVGSSFIYLHQLNKSLALGTGIGGSYEYFSRAMVSAKVQGSSNSTEEYEDGFDNKFRRKFRVYLPLELQYRLTEHLILTGQAQVPLSNRLAASETGFKEFDLGFCIGVNYIL